MAQVLGARGFEAHAVGKWHLGFFKTPYTPTFRGFDSFYGYYEGSEDYYSHTTSGGMDLHHEEGQRCGPGCTRLLWEAKGTYSTNLYTARAVDLISRHDPTTPLFLYLAYQGVHSPRQSPQHYVEPYAKSIPDMGRRVFAGMVSAVDEGVGNVTAALQGKGMLDDTLVFVTTDNGGPTTECSTTGQSNWPLRGSKCSIWEGGTRGTAFLHWSGLPSIVKGSTWMGLAHAADWLPTVAVAVGEQIRPGETLPLDGVDLWGALLRGASPPRREVYYGISQDGHGPAARNTEGYKLILGGSGGGQGAWSPQQLPNRTFEASFDRPMAPNKPVLYHVRDDVGERHSLPLADHTGVVAELQAIIDGYAATKVPQQRGDPSCPGFAPRHSEQGPWIGPWCDGPAELGVVV